MNEKTDIEARATAAALRADALIIQRVKTIDDMGTLLGGLVKIVARRHPEEINEIIDELHAKAMKDPNILFYNGALYCTSYTEAKDKWLIIKKSCPECGASLPYTPDADAPFCELCGVKIFPPDNSSPRNSDSTGRSESESA